jgi:hypothetical protein
LLLTAGLYVFETEMITMLLQISFSNRETAKPDKKKYCKNYKAAIFGMFIFYNIKTYWDLESGCNAPLLGTFTGQKKQNITRKKQTKKTTTNDTIINNNNNNKQTPEEKDFIVPPRTLLICYGYYSIETYQILQTFCYNNSFFSNLYSFSPFSVWSYFSNV